MVAAAACLPAHERRLKGKSNPRGTSSRSRSPVPFRSRQAHPPPCSGQSATASVTHAQVTRGGANRHSAREVPDRGYHAGGWQPAPGPVPVPREVHLSFLAPGRCFGMVGGPVGRSRRHQLRSRAGTILRVPALNRWQRLPVRGWRWVEVCDDPSRQENWSAPRGRFRA